MQEYLSVTFYSEDPVIRDQLSAMLAVLNFEGIDETDGTELTGYLLPEHFAPEKLQQVASALGLDFKLNKIPATNWNATWESNFQPVSLPGYVYIKAPFHTEKSGYEHVLHIMPKMSFGTGHHATTQLMMQVMRSLNLKNKSVLDFGSGTGVLAILAAKLGAFRIMAIDNEPWSVENAKENAAANNCPLVEVQLANSLEELFPQKFDCLLANINLHILKEAAPFFKSILNRSGIALFSGLLSSDESEFSSILREKEMKIQEINHLNGWMMVRANC